MNKISSNDYYFFYSGTFFESQSNSSYKSSPVVAHAPWTYKFLSFRVFSPRLSVISAGVSTPGKSCLFAKN